MYSPHVFSYIALFGDRSMRNTTCNLIYSSWILLHLHLGMILYYWHVFCPRETEKKKMWILNHSCPLLMKSTTAIPTRSCMSALLDSCSPPSCWCPHPQQTALRVHVVHRMHHRSCTRLWESAERGLNKKVTQQHWDGIKLHSVLKGTNMVRDQCE